MLAGNLEQWALAPIEDRPTTRDRQAEFDQREPIAKADLLRRLESAVDKTAQAIETSTAPADLLRHCQIDGVHEIYHTDLLSVVFHAVSHFEGHTQEIISMTRQQLGERYAFLWTGKPAPKAP